MDGKASSYFAVHLSMSIPVQQAGLLLATPVHGSPMPHWLTRLGALGLFSVAVVDSSPIPLPIPGSTDLLLLWLVAHDGDPWLLAAMAIAGSLVGGYTTWGIGRKGGEAALHRYVPARLLGRVVKWVERHRILAVFLPAVLPPPIPLSPFLLASGALGVSRGRFLAIYGAARTLRYSLIAWLAVAYGRHAIRLWSGTLEKWSTPLMCVFAGVMVAGICFGIWKVRRLRKVGAAEKPTRHKAASRAS
jgi:membrane protein YqaA with SNARE-associated domain